MIWMGGLDSDGDTWLASVMVTISPFVVEVAIVVVDWFDCVVVELIWLLGVMVKKFRCNANWAAISPTFSLCRIATRLMNFFFVFVSVFVDFNSILSLFYICDWAKQLSSRLQLMQSTISAAIFWWLFSKCYHSMQMK